jgi:hypothetical protein
VWPGGDVAIVVLLGVWSAFAWLAVRALRGSDDQDRDEDRVVLAGEGG